LIAYFVLFVCLVNLLADHIGRRARGDEGHVRARRPGHERQCNLADVGGDDGGGLVFAHRTLKGSNRVRRLGVIVVLYQLDLAPVDASRGVDGIGRYLRSLADAGPGDRRMMAILIGSWASARPVPTKKPATAQTSFTPARVFSANSLEIDMLTLPQEVNRRRPILVSSTRDTA
jgi:hypothetical protein